MNRSSLGMLLVVCLFVWTTNRRAECSDPTPQASRVAIDAGKTREPLSKYVYGQFIEHLGRCIYGGIWAEMLEDRNSSTRSDRNSRRGKSSGRPDT